MKNTSRILLIMTICMTMVFIIGAMSGVVADNEKPEVVLKLSNAGPAIETDKTYIANDAFKDIVEYESNGRIKVENYHASELGNERETFEGMITGTIEMGSLTTGALPGFFKDIEVLKVPYVFKSEAIALDVINGPFGEKLSQRMIEESNIRPLVWADHGYRTITNNIRPIEEPDDLEGLKIRTMDNPAHMKTLEALGANPVPMGFDELYTGLSQGTVDGQLNPINNIYGMKFHEVQDYMTLGNEPYYTYLGLFISEDVYQTLSKEDQRLIQEAAHFWMYVQSGLSRKQNINKLNDIRDELEINTVSLEKRKEFAEKAQPPVLEYLRDTVGEDLVEDFLNAVEQSEKKLGY